MKTRSTTSHAMRAASVLLTLFAVLLTLGGVAAADEARKPTAERSHIDMVVALDTSNSMDGLIDSARQKIWDLVNDLFRRGSWLPPLEGHHVVVKGVLIQIETLLDLLLISKHILIRVDHRLTYTCMTRLDLVHRLSDVGERSL